MITGQELSLFGGNMYKDQVHQTHYHQEQQQKKKAANQPSDHDGTDIFHFIQRILKRTQLSCTTLILALIYIDRFKARLARTLKRRTRLDQGPDYEHARKLDISPLAEDLVRNDSDTLPVSPSSSCLSSNTTSPSSGLSSSTLRSSNYGSDCNSSSNGSSTLKHGQKPWSSISLFLVAVICADKYLFDATFSNAEWADFTRGQYTTVELNDLERRFLCHLQYKLYVGEPEFDGFLSYLEVVLALKQVWGRGLITFSYSDVRILTQQLMPAYAGRLHFKALQGDMLAIIWQVMATFSRVYLAIVGTFIVAAAGYTAITELSQLAMESKASTAATSNSFAPLLPPLSVPVMSVETFSCLDDHQAIHAAACIERKDDPSRRHHEKEAYPLDVDWALAHSVVVQYAV
ncbi:hypothetical protein BC939DRAFT_33115 [Gamsiella multidivaricata]|uniref:uncharacterized protein n=1 Tax=Gamsiella multidivaricata TaxID=101098 RepID=UPI00221F9E3A|nr:uncharacterized protein BC939DRAFT_33115 [Gamsiella multidivaricata]KAI7816721.1 hypothetical protein BC939DRAFT_33115 [Gamsiella multidivaricata]